jgi:hypothetical protein
MSTVGEKEIQEVRQCYGITLSGPEQILGGLFASGVRLAGTLYASACRMSPGNLRGIGHKYDELWGGLAG